MENVNYMWRYLVALLSLLVFLGSGIGWALTHI